MKNLDKIEKETLKRIIILANNQFKDLKETNQNLVKESKHLKQKYESLYNHISVLENTYVGLLEKERTIVKKLQEQLKNNSSEYF